VHTNSTWFFQGFQTERRGGDLRLLICGLTEVGSERAPQSFEAEQGNRRGARHVAAVTEA